MMSSARAIAKAELRTTLRHARAALPPDDRHEQSHAMRRLVAEHLDAAAKTHGDRGPAARPVVAAFLGIPPEPSTAPLLADLHHRGFHIVLPVCEPEYRLSWAFWTPGAALERSVRATVHEPSGPRHAFADVGRVALILVPALGVDRDGNRVGQGGGYYDRFLAQHPADTGDAAPRCGMVYRSELLPAGAVPAESWDQRLTGVFTPDGFVEVSTAAASG